MTPKAKSKPITIGGCFFVRICKECSNTEGKTECEAVSKHDRSWSMKPHLGDALNEERANLWATSTSTRQLVFAFTRRFMRFHLSFQKIADDQQNRLSGESKIWLVQKENKT